MSSRRELNSTNETAYSVSSDLRRNAEITLQYLADAELTSLPDDAVIQRSLSVKTVVSTSSSFAQCCQQAVGQPHLQQIVQIGAGMQVGRSIAMKKEFLGNATLTTNLLHEYSLHRAVIQAFDCYDDTIRSDVRVPQLFDVIHATDDRFWSENLVKFLSVYRTRTDMVQMERILPLPKVVRKALIAHFYPHNDNAPLDSVALGSILNDTPNKHCLARIYLGRENGMLTREGFSLRNFPLYLKPMQELGLDVVGLASAMGKAFAIMHWGAGVNGDDVEFVLGSSTVGGEEGGNLNFQHRAIRFYLLDFGQCDFVNFSGDQDEVYQAFKGAMVTGDNQLFIPHYEKSRELYAVFKAGYMDAAQVILKERGMEKKFSIEDFMAEYEEYAEDFLV
ncbi:hypothetical protein B0H67DRAFT_604450 [Lasiosphaeris hirsuta]|uniref:DUF3669 domain-containing protein n=1 Tax=Lasiosphaeris hirsuta TaxID=260670 RepID=A0AA39ZSI9_9PEZI|nr:hypothetical protein B0H67DRAFT_604450 [Lasiosphaeris hirsuta]